MHNSLIISFALHQQENTHAVLLGNYSFTHIWRKQ